MRRKRNKASSKPESKGIPRRQVMALAGALAASGVTRAISATAGVDRVGAASNRTFTVTARPSPIKIASAQTAVLVVDMQNDFGAKGGMFDLAGIDISGIRKAIEPTARVLGAARAAGLPVVYLRMGFLPDLSDLGTPDSVNRMRHLQIMHVGNEVHAPDGRLSRILVRDTWNTEILPELTPHKNDLVMYKTRFSGFYSTGLDARLRAAKIKYLIVTGCTTSICVESTVRDAMFRDYLCVLLSDCMSEPIGSNFTRTNHDASLLTIETLFGWVTDSRQFIGAIS
jgi:ureidoacrylate peracid hydrolase